MTQPTVSLTISQGLRRVKKLKGLLAEAQSRACAASTWIEGKEPAFTFEEQRTLRGTHQAEMIRLQAAIARANALTRITVEEKEISLAQAVRQLEELKTDLAWLAALNLRQGTEETTDYVYDEGAERNIARTKSTTHKAALTEPKRAAEVQTLRDRFDAINDAVETANHRTAIELT
jgi:predicted kinase